jgi:hypothetical protein
MRRTVAILGLVSGIAAAPAAWAGDAPVWPPPPPQRPPEPAADDGNFGWQVVVADVAGFATTIALTQKTDSFALLLPFLLAAPTVHALHGDGLGTVGSLLLNAGLPTAGVLLGWELDALNCGPDEEACGAAGAIVGGMIGLGTAVALDAVFLSHPDRSTSGPSIQVTPTVDPNRMFSLVLSGRF